MKRKHAARGVLSIEEAAALQTHGLLGHARSLGFLPPIAGGAQTYPYPATNPLSAPTISGTTITIDVLLAQPTRVTRQVADLVMSNFFLDDIFAIGGDVSGGAVLYDQAYFLDEYTDRDVERVAPGAEHPIVTGVRPAPLIAQVEKFGGKFPVTDEAKRRNDPSIVSNQMRRLANTITRKMNQRGLAELAAAVTAYTRTSAATVTWAAGAAEEVLKRKALNAPSAAVALVKEANEANERGYVFDTLVANPLDVFYARAYYGTTGSFEAAMKDVGITNIVTTPQKAAKSAYILASKMVGQMRLEEPMRTVVEREGAPDLREQTWVQTAINPVFFVTDPFAVEELTNLS